jgi:tetratricopeptide (TPR) repeat protein
MGGAGTMKVLTAITFIVLLAVGLTPQSAVAQGGISPFISQKRDEPKWLRDWRLKQDLDEAAQLEQRAIKLFQQGRYAEAEPLFKRALKIAEKLLGPENPAIAELLESLAVLYKVQGRYPDAESLLKRALEIKEKTLGRSGPRALSLISNERL